MATSDEIKRKALELSEKTDSNSISPKEVGGIMHDLASLGENAIRNGGTLGIRKVYTSVSVMEADKNPKDFWGNPMKKGNLVLIYDGTTTGLDNNKIYVYMNPGWEFATYLDAGYPTRQEFSELGSLLRYSENNEVNISKLFPTGGIDGTNVYTLDLAIEKITYQYYKQGLKCTFLNPYNETECWMYDYGYYDGETFKNPLYWKQLYKSSRSLIESQDIQIEEGIGYGQSLERLVNSAFSSAQIEIKSGDSYIYSGVIYASFKCGIIYNDGGIDQVQGGGESGNVETKLFFTNTSDKSATLRITWLNRYPVYISKVVLNALVLKVLENQKMITDNKKEIASVKKSFTTGTDNLLDLTKAIYGYRVDTGKNGMLVTANNYLVIEKVEVEPFATYYTNFSGNAFLAYYDKDGNYKSGYLAGGVNPVIQIPVGVQYADISFNYTYAPFPFFSKTNEYKPYGITDEKLYLSNNLSEHYYTLSNISQDESGYFVINEPTTNTNIRTERRVQDAGLESYYLLAFTIKDLNCDKVRFRLDFSDVDYIYSDYYTKSDIGKKIIIVKKYNTRKLSYSMLSISKNEYETEFVKGTLIKQNKPLMSLDIHGFASYVCNDKEFVFGDIIIQKIADIANNFGVYKTITIGVGSKYDIQKLDVEGKRLTINAIGDSLTAQDYMKYINLDKYNITIINNGGHTALKGDSNCLIESFSTTTPDCDVCLILAGGHDHGRNLPLGNFENASMDNLFGQMTEYLTMLSKKYSDNTRIIWITYPNTYISSSESRSNGYNDNGVSLYDWTRGIKEVCERFGIPVIDYNVLSGINKYSCQGYPNLFVKSESLDNTKIDNMGNLISDSNYFTSNIIKLEEGKVLSISDRDACYVVSYDVSMNHIHTSEYAYVAEGAIYVRIVFAKGGYSNANTQFNTNIDLVWVSQSSNPLTIDRIHMTEDGKIRLAKCVSEFLKTILR